MTEEKKHNGIRYLLIACMLLAFAVSVGWYMNRNAQVTNISVHGNRITEMERIVEVSSIQIGKPAEEIDFLQVIVQVEKLPWVERAFVDLTPAGRLRIRVEEEKPLAILIDRGRSALVSGNGLILPVILEEKMDVPILYGFSMNRVPDHEAAPDTLNTMDFLTVRNFLQTAELYPGLYAMISEVMFTTRDGVVALSDESAVRLTFGHGPFDDKMRNWKAFQKKVVSSSGMNQFWSLDFRYRGQIVANER
ncbi:FtsQ-type POTRA domain-containing protein [Balneolaceae bacterium ANBcel3]|nr:FtsQ-type POTRA domain-containing protein [Balneolaceae bacterium ANBcel3]